MRILVCGDRDWTDQEFVWNVLDELQPSHVIEGHARGADRAAHAWAEQHMPKEALSCRPADWPRYGKPAGPIRNAVMLALEPDLVLAFHDHIEMSKGTADMLCKAADKGVLYVLVTHEDEYFWGEL